MATTGKNVTQTVTTDFKQVGAEGLQQALKSMLLSIEAIPEGTKKINPVITQLGTQLKTLAQSFAQNKVGTEDWLVPLKEIQATLTTIKTLSAGLKLFEKNDIDQLKAALRQKSASPIDPRTVLGLPSDAQMKNTAKISASVFQEEFAKETMRNKSASRIPPETLLGLPTREQTKAISREIAAQFREGVQTETMRAKSASAPDARQLLTGQTQENRQKDLNDLRSYIKEQSAIAEQYDAQQKRFADMRARHQARQAKDEAKANAPSAGQRALESRAALSTGEGAASLLLIQGALMANSALINGAIGSIKQTIAFSVELEASFRNVQAVVGTTQKEMLGLEDTIKQVSTSTRFNALEVAEAALTLGQAGLSAKQISESILPVVTLANAAGSSIAQAVDLVTSVVGVFDKNASDVADVANKITQAANGSKVSVDKLALGFQYAGNTASQLGISFEEVTAAMAAMSNAGIKSGSTMGTGLRQFLVEVQKPSEDFLKILSRLGLSISDLDFKSKGFIGVIRTLKEAGFVASDAIQSFDVRGAAAFNALLARPDDLQAQYDSLGGSQAAMKANEIQMNSLSAQTSRLTNTLGSLASTGFDPVIKTLTGFVRLMGDALNPVTELSGGLKILGTVLAALAGAAVVSWLAPLVAGMGNLLTMLPGLISGTTALGGALSTTMIASGVGIAIVALVAAYTAYNYITGETTRNIDEATAALSKAKGAVQEKDEAITSLNNRLDLLKAREESLVPGTADFNTQVRESAELIARWGYNTDGATSSLGALAGRLREVRNEMAQMRLADLQQVAAEATKVSNLQNEELKVKSTRIQQRLGQNGGLFGEQFAGKDDFLKSLNPQQRSMAEKVFNDLTSGKGAEVATRGDSSQVAAWMSNFRSQNGKSMSLAGRADFDWLQGQIGELNAQAGSARQARGERDRAVGTAAEQTSLQKLKDSLRGQGIDVDQLGTGNLAAKAKSGLSAEDQKDAVKINDATRNLVAQRRQELEAQEAKAVAQATTDFERQFVQTQFRAAREKSSEALRQSAPAATSQLDRQEKLSSDDEELRKIQNRLRAKGGGTAADRARAEELIRNQANLKFKKATVGMEDTELLNATKVQTDREAQEKIDALTDTVNRAGSAAASSALKSQESSYRALAEAKMRDAKSSRGRANANMPLEDLSKLMDEGLDKIAEAKKIEVESIARQYSPGSVEYKNLTEAAEEKYTAAAQTFIGSFSGLIETATVRMTGISLLVKQTDAKIKKMVNEAEEALYRDQAGLRDNAREVAQNTGPVSGRRRSEADALMTTERGYALSRQDARNQVSQKQGLSEVYTASRRGAQGLLSKAEAELADLTQKRDSLLAGRDTTQLGLEDAAKNTEWGSRIKSLTDEVTKGQNSVEGYTNKIQGLRKEIEELNNKAEGLTEGVARPETWDELATSLGKVVDAYAILNKQQSVFTTLENGLLGTFKGLQGQFSNFFVEVASGTKSVGDAFRSMAISIIKSMMDVLAQALAMQAVKSILGMFSGSFGGGGAAAAPAGNYAGNSLIGSSVPMAEGGPVMGGVPGKDSVPIMGMPGEFMLKKSAVDAVGYDFLNNLNENAGAVMQSSSSSMGRKNDTNSGGQKVVNVWLVTPDQMGSQSMGPNDIIATVSDDIARGGSIKKLIQSVAMGV